MNWQEVCEHPSLQNLPFKIELDEYGNIVMSPVKIYHSLYTRRNRIHAALLTKKWQNAARMRH